MRSIFVFVLMISALLILFQSSDFYNEYFSIANIKFNLILVIFYMMALTFSPLYMSIYTLVIGFFIDYVSSAFFAFYTVLFLLLLIFILFMQSFFRKIIFPIYMFLAMSTFLMKGILENMGVFFKDGQMFPVYYWSNIGFKEFFINTFGAMILYPIFVFFRKHILFYRR